MQKSEGMVRELLSTAEIEVNGVDPWDVQVHDDRFFDRILRDGSLGLGESYMDGWWDCDAIDEMINRALKARLDEKVRSETRYLIHAMRAKLFNRQSVNRAFEVGEKHYDLGNDLYRAMLDKRLCYSCAYWKDAKSLDQAQEAKLELVCKKMNVKPGMRILDIGSGWGSFAKYAAEKHGASVIGLTVSREQIALGQELCNGLPVEFRLQDYRDIEEPFDAIVSIGMMEHVGYKNYRTFMQVVDRCLKPDGIAVLHTIGGNQSVTAGEPFTDKYIFPNGMLPSLAQLSKAMEGIFVIEDLHNIGPHYDTTLMAWHANFEKAWPDLREKYGERFHRMWRYYLLSSAGGFRSRSQQLWQIVFTRIGTAQPMSRYS